MTRLNAEAGFSPSGPKSLRLHGEHSSYVVAATTSPARIAALKWLLPDACVIPVNGGKEEETDNTGAVASAKAERARKLMRMVPVLWRSKPPIVAADTRTFVYSLVSDEKETPVLHFGSRGKPGSSDEVRQLFGSVHRIYVQNPLYPTRYVVESSTTVVMPNNTHTGKHIAWVELNPHAVQDLATENGARVYVEAYKEYNRDLWDLPPELNDVLRVDPTHISSGFSLEVLLRLGAVDAINGTHRGEPRFEQAVRGALLVSTIGLPPEPVRTIYDREGSIRRDWPVLDTAVSLCLGHDKNDHGML